MSNIRLQQTLIIGAIVLLLAFLFTRDVKGLVKPKEESAGVTARTASPEAESLNLDEISRGGKNLIGTEQAKEITSLEQELKKAPEAAQSAIAEKLSRKWDAVSQSVPSALYLEMIAKRDSSAISWVKTGEKYLQAFDGTPTSDSTLQVTLLQKANSAFDAALKIDSTDISAKTGLGITIVNGLGAPMEGIAMLLDVVKKSPDNYKANMQLGMFAMTSGQFDKAIIRFEHVLEIKKTSEAYFNLGIANENQGNKTEAIAAYLESKRIAVNPKLSEFVDKKVAELKK